MSSVIKNLLDIAIPFEKELGQLRPSTTNPETIYSPPTNIVSTEVKSIFVANVSGGDTFFRIFVDQDGTTYDETTAIVWEIAIKKETGVTISDTIFMDNPSGSIGVRTKDANALNFTVYGVEITTK